jgi:hypothetical protein
MHVSEDDLPDICSLDALTDSDTNESVTHPSETRRILRDPVEWASAWEEELAILFHVAQDHCTSLGLPILDECSFHDFVTFAFQTSSRVEPIV